MSKTVTVFVAAAVLFAIGLGIAGGLDAQGMTILMLVIGAGVLAVAVARRAEGGFVDPGKCDNCGGLVSPNAPYCKHCGIQIESERL
ncbi:MAG TPA: zinc ribbon domain-containing protein [Actinomycetota bacterium]|nr:zinc ribbon domain-containing protein [Actinomycetota bacterium]